MNSRTITTIKPLWLAGFATFGVLWNAYGIYQFAASFSQTTNSLMRSGLSPMQADLYLALPAWMDVAFGTGVFAGLAGSAALLLGRAASISLLGLSLVAYLVLFAGDAYYGLFAIPSQLAILSFVVAVAVALFGTALQARRRMLLA